MVFFRYQFFYCFLLSTLHAVAKLNATATQMDVEDSSTAFAPVASEAVVIVHVPNPVQP